MSWIVETLLINRNTIRASPDPEIDDYTNLLLIEKKIEEMMDKNMFSIIELDIIELFFRGYIIKDIHQMVGISRRSFYEYFKRLSDKIGFCLGGYFTDDGYVEYMTSKYNLSEDQVSLLNNYIRSTYKRRNYRPKDKK